MSVNKDLQDRFKKINGGVTSFIPNEMISLDHPLLDGIFGGGFPRGSIIQLAAQSGVGKTTLALQISKILCSKGFNVLYVDVENGLNQFTLETTGVLPYVDNFDTDIGGLFSVINENDCNKINIKLQQYNESNLADVFIIDSLGALDAGLYTLESKGDVNNPKVGGNSKAISSVMSTINGIRASKEKSFILINHLTQVIGSYIPQEKPKGGTMVQFIPDTIIYLKANTGASGALKNSGGQKLGQKVTAEAKKSRMGGGNETIPFYIRFGRGVAMIPTLVDLFKDKKEIDTPEGTRNVLTITPGGSNNHLYLPSGDYTFRGSDFNKDLVRVIAEHYDECMSIVNVNDFKVNIKDSDEIDQEFKINKTNNQDILKHLPPTLQELKVIQVEGNQIYFDRGVDADGQPYSISYNINGKELVLEYNSQEKSKPRPSIAIYNDFKKTLSDYLNNN